MTLKDKYENYLKKKSEYEKQNFYYEEKEKELRNKVIDSLTGINIEALTELGFTFELDSDNLEDSNYLIQKVNEIRHIRSQLDERGHKILEGY